MIYECIAKRHAVEISDGREVDLESGLMTLG